MNRVIPMSDGSWSSCSRVQLMSADTNKQANIWVKEHCGHQRDKAHRWFPPRGGSSYHFERGQYQDDVADLAAVLPPVLRPLQTGDAHVSPLEMLHVAAGAEREKDVSRSALHFHTWTSRSAAALRQQAVVFPGAEINKHYSLTIQWNSKQQ